VYITSGCSGAVVMALQVLLNEGERVNPTGLVFLHA
jgi:aspartate/methionine/tyrosine aminotransferase